MSRIRIAQRAWEGAAGVGRIGPETLGVDLMWIEIDGYRIADVEGVTVAFAAGCSVPEVTVRPFGTVEVVYLNPMGEEIGSVHADPRALVGNEYAYGTQHRRPPLGDLDRAIRDRDVALARVAELEETYRRLLAAEQS